MRENVTKIIKNEKHMTALQHFWINTFYISAKISVRKDLLSLASYKIVKDVKTQCLR